MQLLDDPEFLEQGFDLIEFYRQYPELAAWDLLHVDLSDIQKVVLRAMWFKNYVMAIMCRGAGKTFLLAVFACLKALLYPGHKVGLIAPTFRQSKLIFDECRKLHQNSLIFQMAVERPPVQQSDNCQIIFKAAAGRNPSEIRAIPLGDGTKIRGSRFFTILCDEFPHIKPEIFNMVIRPMAATASNPMERARRMEKQQELLARGLTTEEEIAQEMRSTNQIIITSSGYFTFNHMYKMYCSYKSAMLEGDDNYAVFRVPYKLLPPAFLSEENLAGAKREMSSLQFRMEYEADFITDTDSFFRASLLEACSQTTFSTQLYGTPGKKYCLGIDPARTEDAFAVVVIELGQPCRIVHAIERYQLPFPQMAALIEQLCSDFDVEHIFMDSQGGGHAIKDILAENLSHDGRGPILDPDDEVHLTKQGRHILTLCNPTSEFIHESNHNTLKLLERGDLFFPSSPVDGNEDREEAWDTVQRMKMQMQTIAITQTPTGKYHFDVPKGGGHEKQKKDLYSACLHAAQCAYQLVWTEGMPDNFLHQGGVFTPRPDPYDRIQGRKFGGEDLHQVPQVFRDKLEIATDPEGYRRRLLQKMQSQKPTLVSSAAVLTPKPKKRK